MKARREMRLDTSLVSASSRLHEGKHPRVMRVSSSTRREPAVGALLKTKFVFLCEFYAEKVTP